LTEDDSTSQECELESEQLLDIVASTAYQNPALKSSLRLGKNM
jgi:hypothetical protein